VEVKAPSETRQVKAGHLVRWQEGQLTEESFTPVAAPPKKTGKTAAAVPTPAIGDTPPIPSEPQTKLEVIPPPAQNNAPSPVSDAVKEDRRDGSGEEEWARLPAPPSEAVKPEPAVQGKPLPAAGGAPDSKEAKEPPPAPK